MDMKEAGYISSINSHVNPESVSQWLRTNLMFWTERGVQELTRSYMLRVGSPFRESRLIRNKQFRALLIDVKEMDRVFNVAFTE